MKQLNSHNGYRHDDSTINTTVILLLLSGRNFCKN